MILNGSCHCKLVTYTVESQTAVPFMRCFCSICRKTGGSGGYGINLGANNDTLEVKGIEHTSVYHAIFKHGIGNKEVRSSAERRFCKHCGSALWLFSPEYPHLVHPYASSVDTELPVPPSHVNIMLDSAPAWAKKIEMNGPSYEEYPPMSLLQWHEEHESLT
ncbi:glutathione-dependent formaldehyde-activating enzyme [Schizosaccharomyces japonicus yFS275]|uniref:Glutathione-dependent formaldehyde-activating enzyme n=1 Tax=Schizosaccharomyces japonicus (strain yFS275 / FY16936) TaxID=402676 RepID=B6K1N3_SCHJY|nr:glutathione-dependent formaldehyde-activating enzyme [Schizosaccharomyces japonicus yFS275]EEB07064.1 glutathione-dependent formaldehyde-activating enzyme [Schizosaccharomyces japonicus yFS275]